MRNLAYWIVALSMLAVVVFFVYEFVTHVQPGALDCAVTWGDHGCNQ